MADEPVTASNPLARVGDSALESGSLAREMVGSYREALASYHDRIKLAQADPSWDGPAALDDPEAVVEEPADHVSWFKLAELANCDPQRQVAVWEEIKQEAREELASGHRAAKALECFSGPWERAQFLGIREAFIDEWAPRGGIEHALIDTMAQAQTAYLMWLSRLQFQVMIEAQPTSRAAKRPDSWQPPRLDAAAAMEQSAAMADRFQRMFLRALRALRDLRRYAPEVHIANAGQVNLAQGPQVNVAQCEPPNVAYPQASALLSYSEPGEPRDSERGRARRSSPSSGARLP